METTELELRTLLREVLSVVTPSPPDRSPAAAHGRHLVHTSGLIIPEKNHPELINWHLLEQQIHFLAEIRVTIAKDAKGSKFVGLWKVL